MKPLGPDLLPDPKYDALYDWEPDKSANSCLFALADKTWVTMITIPSNNLHEFNLHKLLLNISCPSINPFSKLLLLFRATGGWTLSQHALAKRRCTPRTLTLTLILRAIKSPIQQTGMFLDCGRKPTQTWGGHANSTQRGGGFQLWQS